MKLDLNYFILPSNVYLAFVNLYMNYTLLLFRIFVYIINHFNVALHTSHFYLFYNYNYLSFVYILALFVRSPSANAVAIRMYILSCQQSTLQFKNIWIKTRDRSRNRSRNRSRETESHGAEFRGHWRLSSTHRYSTSRASFAHNSLFTQLNISRPVERGLVTPHLWTEPLSHGF